MTQTPIQPEPPPRTPPPDGRLAWDILWVGMLALYVLAGRPIVPFHGDESAHIAMSVDYAYQFIERDYSKVLYSETPHNPVEQGLRLIDGSLNRYTIGLAWHLAGFTPDDLNAPWWWDQDYEYNMNNNYYPGDDLLLVSRIPSTIFTALAVGLVFVLGAALQGRAVGYMASLYFGLNPAVLISGRRAMTEGSHLFFQLLTLLAGIWLLNTLVAHQRQHPHRTPLWVNGLLLGLSGGLALASKHTNALVIAIVFAAVLGYALIHARRAIWRTLITLTGSGVLVLGVFLLLNPAWWSDPVGRGVMVVQDRADVLAHQIDKFQTSYNNDPLQKLIGLWRLVFEAGPNGQPQYYEAQAWAAYIPDQIATYEATVFAGFFPPGVGVVLLVSMGIGYAVLLGVLKPVPLGQTTQWVLRVWGVAVLIYAAWVVPLGWQRYYLPFLPMVGITAGLGIVWVYQTYIGNAESESPVYRKGSRRVS